MPARKQEFTIFGFDATGHRRVDESETYRDALAYKRSMERIGWRDVKVYDVNLREISPEVEPV